MSVASLRNHQKTHTKVANLSCEHCNKKFYLRKYLIVHMTRYHVPAWYYRCLECNAERSTLDNITQHCAAVHVQGNSQVARLSHATCRECGDMFASNLLLERHVHKLHPLVVDKSAIKDENRAGGTFVISMNEFYIFITNTEYYIGSIFSSNKLILFLQ